MGRIVVLLAVTLACFVGAESAAPIWGGATSIATYAPAIIKKYGRNFPPYDSVGSGAGIKGFISKKYGIAASDDPLSAAQDAQAGGKAKLTLPLTLGVYALVTKKARGLKITEAQAAAIYTGKITKWSQIKKGLTGAIVPVARADGSGTTELFGLYFYNNGKGAWPKAAITTATWKGIAGISSHVVYQTGSGGVASYVAANANRIGYVQAGIGVTEYKNYEVALKNPAGFYVFASSADPQQSIPRPLPNPSAVWAGVSLLNKVGKSTYPVASFVYLFARKKYATAKGASLVKAFLTFTQTNPIQKLAPTYFFFPLPTYVLRQNIVAIKTIT